MANITHQKARALLQAAANKTLLPEEQGAIHIHLAECNECRAYAQNLNELQDGLRRVMRQQWNIENTRLPIRAIKERSKRIALQNKISGTIGRFAVVPMLAFVFVMAVRMIAPQQIALNPGAMTSLTPQLSGRTPTPTYRNTSIELSVRDCEKAVYTVQENDTLDGIAAMYAVPREAIMTYNRLATDKLDTNTELIIPLCDLTPTGTSTIPAVTNTIVPQNGAVNPSPTG